MSQAQPLIKIPKSNPIRLYLDGVELPFAASLPKWMAQVKYSQIFSRFDELAFQIFCENDVTWDMSNIITVNVLDINDKIVLTYSATQLNGGSALNGYYIYEVREQLTGLSAGTYQIEVHIKNETQLIPPTPTLINEYYLYSEPIEVKDIFPDSITIDYVHEDNSNDIICVDPNDSSIHQFRHRIYGGFLPSDYQPASKDYVYRDQIYDLTQLKSIPFETSKLTFGKIGIPNWQANILSRIFTFSSVYINSSLYVKNDGAKMEKTNPDKIYPLNGWKIELIRPTNELSTTYGGGDFNNDFSEDFFITL